MMPDTLVATDLPGPAPANDPAALRTALEVVPDCLRHVLTRMVDLASSLNDAVAVADRLVSQLPPEHRPAAAGAFAGQQVAVLETVRELEVVVEKLAKRIDAAAATIR
jgi:hypothetical protein